MVESPLVERVPSDQLSSKARELISDIRENHRLNKMEKLRNRLTECREIKEQLRQKYVELIDLLRDSKPNSATHFRISRSGDVVFVNSGHYYGQAFKRLWSLHLPLC